MKHLLALFLFFAVVPAAISQRDYTRSFQKGIDQASTNKTNTYHIPEGHYLISAPLLIPSNFTLTADPKAYIELKKSSNQYLLRNRDLVNGNENIRVLGGKWNGNAWTQSRTIRDRVDNSDFCFGFFFYKVKNLEVGHAQIDSTRSWGIAYMECDSVYIHDIRFQQNPFRDARFTSALNHNGDGVTGGANNVLIENISGFTNDDLIAFASGGASFQGKMSPFPPKSYHNITVRNIFPESIYDSIPALKGVAFYTFEHTSVSNITIDRVEGNTAAASVLFYSLFDKKGSFSNVKISRIIGTNVYSRAEHPDLHRAYAAISFKNADIDRLIIDGVTSEERSYAEPVIRFDDAMEVRKLSIRNLSVTYHGVANNHVIDLGKGILQKVELDGIKVSRKEQ